MPCVCTAFRCTFQTLRRLGTVEPVETPVRAVRAPKGAGTASKASKDATVAVPVATVPYVYKPPSGDGVTLPRVWQYNKTMPETPGATSPSILIPGALTSESADNSHAVKSTFCLRPCLCLMICSVFIPLLNLDYNTFVYFPLQTSVTEWPTAIYPRMTALAAWYTRTGRLA